MRNVVLVNPAAGKKDHTEIIRRLCEDYFLKKGLEYDFYVSKYSGNLTEVVKKVQKETDDTITFFCCGGDGTLNEVVNGVELHSENRICVFPCGSGNDFARTLAPDYKPQLKTMDIWSDEDKICDVIKMDDKVSINVCSAGIDAVIADKAQRIKRNPLLTGSTSYLVSILTTVFSGERYDFTVTLDGQEIYDGKSLIVVAANGQYYGGGIRAIPEADPSDGLIDFVLVRSVPQRGILGLLIKYLGGNHQKIDAETATYLRGKCVTVKSKVPVPINLDGEILHINSAEFRIEPRALKVAKIAAR